MGNESKSLCNERRIALAPSTYTSKVRLSPMVSSWLQSSPESMAEWPRLPAVSNAPTIITEVKSRAQMAMTNVLPF